MYEKPPWCQGLTVMSFGDTGFEAKPLLFKSMKNKLICRSLQYILGISNPVRFTLSAFSQLLKERDINSFLMLGKYSH